MKLWAQARGARSMSERQPSSSTTASRSAHLAVRSGVLNTRPMTGRIFLAASRRQVSGLLRRSWVGYVLAIAAVAVGLLLRSALSAQLGEELPAYIAFYPAVIVAALLAGLGPGLLATAVTLVVVDYWIVSPKVFFWRGEVAEITAMVVFAAMGVLVSVLVEQRAGETRRTNEQLRQEIRARRQKEKDLAEAELRYRTVADFTYNWEYWRTSDGALLYCSPSCERVTGYSAPELVGDPALITQMVHPEDQGVWEQHLCDVADKPGPQTVLFRIQRKDGGVRWIEHSCQPVTGKEGKLLGARASNRDVTERKQAEIEAQHLRQELARISQLTTAGQLAAALAHELNQPLGAIVCNAQAAEQYLSQASPALAEIREILSDIEADGQRAGDVIHRLRALYQKRGQERTALQINKVIQETLALMQSEFLLKGVSVRLDLEAALPLVSGDSIQLQQVVINLLANAVDATAAQEADARRLHIATACGEPGTVRISFRDSGTGFTAEQLSRVGEPFFTTKPTGMGMGLAISRSIIEAHGGRLWAENNPDRGATFHLILPVLSDNST
jgi:PAS domain S-box-containing protein